MRTTRDRAFPEVSGLRSSGLVDACRRREALEKLGEGRQKARRIAGSHPCLIINVISCKPRLQGSGRQLFACARSFDNEPLPRSIRYISVLAGLIIWYPCPCYDLLLLTTSKRQVILFGDLSVNLPLWKGLDPTSFFARTYNKIRPNQFVVQGVSC